MITIFCIPRRYRWAYREGQQARRAQLAAGDPNDLSAIGSRVAQVRREREQAQKQRRTMEIARRLCAGEDIPARWPRRSGEGSTR